MNRLAFIVAALALGAGPAAAQDQTYDWSGAYIGAQAGYGWGDTGSSPFFNASGKHKSNEPLNPKGWLGGLQAGYDRQIAPGFVLGIETDFIFTSMHDQKAYRVNPKFDKAIDVRWVGSTRLRGGTAFERNLIYGTAGIAYGSVETATYPIGITGRKDRSQRTGFVIGGGVEHAFTDQWSAKLEYLYYDLGKHDYIVSTTNEVASFDVDFSTIKLGVNFRF